jgi:DNA-binding transcriptional regulator PaaX
MYKRPISKRQRMILKTLANSRKLLLAIAEGYNSNSDIPLISGYSNKREISFEDKIYIEKARIKRVLYELKRRKFIEVRKEGDRLMYILTDKGRLSALKEQIRIADDRNDGKIVLVSFDIPEQESVIRKKLRILLRDCGFERIQNSLWGSKQDVGIQVAELIKEMHGQKWIRVFLSSEIFLN